MFKYVLPNIGLQINRHEFEIFTVSFIYIWNMHWFDWIWSILGQTVWLLHCSAAIIGHYMNQRCLRWHKSLKPTWLFPTSSSGFRRRLLTAWSLSRWGWTASCPEGCRQHSPSTLSPTRYKTLGSFNTRVGTIAYFPQKDVCNKYILVIVISFLSVILLLWYRYCGHCKRALVDLNTWELWAKVTLRKKLKT